MASLPETKVPASTADEESAKPVRACNDTPSESDFDSDSGDCLANFHFEALPRYNDDDAIEALDRHRREIKFAGKPSDRSNRSGCPGEQQGLGANTRISKPSRSVRGRNEQPGTTGGEVSGWKTRAITRSQTAETRRKNGTNSKGGNTADGPEECAGQISVKEEGL